MTQMFDTGDIVERKSDGKTFVLWIVDGGGGSANELNHNCTGLVKGGEKINLDTVNLRTEFQLIGRMR